MAQYISCYIKLEMNRFQASLGYKMKTGVDKQNKIQLSNQTQTSNKNTNTTQNKIQLERRINKKNRIALQFWPHRLGNYLFDRL